MNTSQVDSLPHQIEAVYHHILRSPRVRFLLADDPGAGKTIMTGLLLKALKYRGLVRRTLIVVPGHLKDQWLREMKERFGETFTVVDRGVMNATWGRTIWQEQPQVITSMDFGKQDDVMATLAEARWDLVVVDEAHKMAAWRYGEKTNKTERYRFGELLSRTSQFLLFLTATPHRGDPENFRLFLDLLQPGLFANTDLLLESVQNRGSCAGSRRTCATSRAARSFRRATSSPNPTGSTTTRNASTTPSPNTSSNPTTAPWPARNAMSPSPC